MDKKIAIEVPGQDAPVSALLESPKGASALLLIAHGAVAGMMHPFLSSLCHALHEEGVATLRYQFPYMEQGKGRPDTAGVAIATVAAAARAGRSLSKLPLFAGGKSFGSRMTTTAAAAGEIPDVSGIVCFGFPLHGPKAPAIKRAEHLASVGVPTLFLQGTRDDLADLTLMKQVLKGGSPDHRMHIVDGADHSFNVLKSSGRTPADVISELAKETARFIAAPSKS